MYLFAWFMLSLTILWTTAVFSAPGVSRNGVILMIVAVVVMRTLTDRGRR